MSSDDLAERFARLEQRGKRFSELVAMKIAELRAADPATLETKAVELFKEAAANYGNEKYGEQTVAEYAKAAIFAIQNLAVGKQAPEIEGEDVDGQKLKLSDYRGKVVILDFWGNW